MILDSTGGCHSGRRWNTSLACSFLQALQSYCVQSEGVKNKSKGLQETGLLATAAVDTLLRPLAREPGVHFNKISLL